MQVTSGFANEEPAVRGPLSVIYVETQTGGVGSTVSNGLWVGEPFRASFHFWRCGGGTADAVLLKWRVWAEDFHGNVSTYGTADTPAMIAWTAEG